MITPESLTAVTVPIRKTASVRVDFRGRITMVNDEAEGLIGLSRELLYSRPFTDFIAEIDRPGIAQIVKQRHLQIESSLDLGPITFVSHNGTTQPIRLLISIGYAAGNPANYHIILLPTGGIESISKTVTPTAAEFVVTERDTSADNSQLLEHMVSLSQTEFPESAAILSKLISLTTPVYQNAVYRLDGNSFVCLAASAVGQTGMVDTIDESELTPTNRLHELVCQSRESYRHDQDASIRRAIELIGSAPQELVIPVPIGSSTYCIRGWFKESISTQTIDELCRLLPELATRSTKLKAIHEDQQGEWKITTDGHAETVSGDASTLPILWYRFDSNGTCISRSSVAGSFDCLEAFCDSFGSMQRSELSAKLETFRAVARPNSSLEDIYTLYESGDRIYGWLEDRHILGVMMVAGQIAGSGHQAQISHILPAALHRELAQTFKPLRATASRVLHQHLTKLDSDGQFLMTRLDEQLEGCERLLKVTTQLHRLATEHEPSVPVDISFLFRRKVHDIALSLGCEEPQVSFEHPKKISSSLHACEAMIEAILEALFRESRNLKQVLVSLKEQGNRWSIVMRFPDLKTDERAIKQLMSLHRGFHEQIRTGHGKLEHLSFARVIAQSLSGELHASMGEHSELVLNLTIPMSAAKS